MLCFYRIVFYVTVQTGASHSSFSRQQSIHLREKNIAGPSL